MQARAQLRLDPIRDVARTQAAGVQVEYPVVVDRERREGRQRLGLPGVVVFSRSRRPSLAIRSRSWASPQARRTTSRLARLRSASHRIRPAMIQSSAWPPASETACVKT